MTVNERRGQEGFPKRYPRRGLESEAEVNQVKFSELPNILMGSFTANTLGSEKKRPMWPGQRVTGREAEMGPCSLRLRFWFVLRPMERFSPVKWGQ